MYACSDYFVVLHYISQKRSNKAINLTNIKHACTLAWLTIPPGSAILNAYTNIYYINTKIETTSQVIPTPESCGCSNYEMTWGYHCEGEYYVEVNKISGTPSIDEAQEACDRNFGFLKPTYEEYLRCAEEFAAYPEYAEMYLEMANEILSVMGDCNKCVLAVARCGYDNNCDIPSQTQITQTDPGKVACVWGVGFQRNPNGIWAQDGEIISSDNPSSTVRWGQNIDPSAIYPRLKVDNDKGKIIVETQFRVNSGEAKTAFGLRLVNPKPSTSSNDSFFSSVVIFQPKNELFSGTAPANN